MSLNIPKRAILQVPAIQSLQLDATPFISGDELWDEGVKLLHHWMISQFKYNTVYGDFEFAQALGVHRVIADEWLFGLAHHNRIKSFNAVIGSAGGDGHNEAPVFTVSTPLEELTKVTLTISKEIAKYDPWEDRTFDNDIEGAKYPDLYIDKYFEVMLNEYFIVKRKQRVRPNGRYANPIEYAEHPRYADPKAKKDRKFDPKWRDAISEKANGGYSRKF